MEQTMEVMLANMIACLEKMNAGQEGMLAQIDLFQETKPGHEEMKALLEACPEKMAANPE
jgi:hypothetical protein